MRRRDLPDLRHRLDLDVLALGVGRHVEAAGRALGGAGAGRREPPGPGGGGGAAAAGRGAGRPERPCAAPGGRRMSSLVTRPWAPVPWTSSRLTPSLAAMLRTSGLENLRSRSSTPPRRLVRPRRRRAGSGSRPRGLPALARRWGRARARPPWGGPGATPSRAVSSRFTSVAGWAAAPASARRPPARRRGAGGCSPASPIDGHHLVDGDGLPLLVADLQQRARGRAGDLGVDLVGRDLEQRLVALHLVAHLHQPAGDGALGDRLPHLGHHDFSCHKLSRLSVQFSQLVGGSSRTLATSLSTFGR